ncbi:hypothetical protein [Nitratireductor luteus]|uniref:hypothetical protein n=1 Tax=Nitratireductor luteus TaxID=2976980 RepID=UPI00223F9B96|nr:hypothetical protein [Nitratireductor luteus]
MKHTAYLVLAFAVSTLTFIEPASSKTCKCDNHNAEASGASTCSLSESPDYCTISFPTPAPAQSSPADMFERNLYELEGADVEFEDFAFAAANINDYPLKPVYGDALASLALSAIPTERVNQVSADFAAMFAADSASLKTFVDDFNQDGCVEAEQGMLRILIIAFQSEKNGRCE